MGKNVFSNISCKEGLVGSIKAQSSGFIIQKHVFGDEYRVYTVGGKAVAFCKRDYPNVVGDGRKNIQALIKDKNYKKEKMRIQKIKINDELFSFLSAKGLSLEYVPDENEKVVLSDKRGRSSGGDIVQSVSGVSSSMVERIERFSKSLSGSYVLGIDCIVNDGSLYVIEVNFRPQITSALLPDLGESVDLPKKIVDGLFGDFYDDIVEPIFFKNYLKKAAGWPREDWESLSFKGGDVLARL